MALLNIRMNSKLATGTLKSALTLKGHPPNLEACLRQTFLLLGRVMTVLYLSSTVEGEGGGREGERGREGEGEKE